MLALIRRTLTLAILVARLTSAAPSEGESAGEASPPGSRLEQIQQAREDKARNLEPEVPGRVERLVERAVTVGFLSEPSGLGLKLGGLLTGAGFSLGPRYYRPDLWSERVQLDLAAVGSLNRYYALEAGLAFPRLAGLPLDAAVSVRRNDYPSIPYFGSGPRTGQGRRTNFRREDNFVQARAGWHPLGRRLLLGGEASLLRQNVGPGVSDDSPSSDAVFNASDAAAIDFQPRYVIAGPFAQLDFRDSPGDPRSGGAYLLRYLHYSDRNGGRFSFDRLEAQAERYFSFWNGKRVIALYSRAQLSFTDEDQRVPFYLQTSMGGPGDLRGFTQFRFRDENALVSSVEYRWEVLTGFDMALFADAGNVFPRPGLIGFRNLQGGGGIGLRFKTRDNLAFRVDFGASREGLRVWISTADVFSQWR